MECPIPPSVLWLDSVESTQRVAVECVLQNDRRYTLICARHQTAGRGRKGAEWYDEPDTSLLVSLILWEVPIPDPVGLLGMVGAMAVAELIDTFLQEAACPSVPLALKYPNDVLLAHRKVAGVLAEVVQAVPIVGIGLNVAQAQFPPELRAKAISIRQVAGMPTPEQFLRERARWVHRLYTAFHRWQQQAHTAPVRFYQQWCVRDSSAGRLYRMLETGEIGTAVSVEPDFRLRLRLPTGREVATYYVESIEP